MRLIRGLRNLRESHRGSVVTVGTFDGIHLGHRALIERVIEHGRRLGRPTMMLTFEPMPREHLVLSSGRKRKRTNIWTMPCNTAGTTRQSSLRRQ